MAGGIRPRAPGALELVQAFVNTIDIEAGVDEFADVGGLRTWLASRSDDTPADLNGRDLERVIELREAMRGALEANANRRPDGRVADDRLQAAAARLPLRVEGSPDGPVLEPAGAGIEVPLGRTLAAAIRATADGTWRRLKVCRNDSCRWAYWDGSRNRSGVWCAMAVCGNRAKGQAFRARRSVR